MLAIKYIRVLAPLAILLGTQVGLFLVLREILAPRPEQASRRRAIVLVQAVVLFGMVSIYLAGRAGVVLAGPLRWLAQPLMAAFLLMLPALLILGALVSVAHRVRPASPPFAGPEGDQTAAPLSEARRVFLVRTATGLLGGSAALAAAGIHSAEAPPVITRLDIKVPGLHPDLDGLTIVQLSDIHAGMLMTEERMAAIAREAAALGADLAVFTGDLLDMSHKAAGPYARAFAGLHGKLGTFAILGNHDYYAGARAATRAVGDAGGVLLRNGGARIERGKGTLWLGGVDDPGGGGAVDFAKALRGAAPEEARVMLCHRPNLFPLCAKAGSQLVLSGHTHGGQIALGRLLTPARLLGPYTMGHFEEQGSQLFVHRGLGVVAGAPLRLGAPPEIALLTLRRS